MEKLLCFKITKDGDIQFYEWIPYDFTGNKNLVLGLSWVKNPDQITSIARPLAHLEQPEVVIGRKGCMLNLKSD